ncbi:MAG: FtsH protease activity modulator HflK [Alphaproteobacteria bacterium]|nr:FtsH protease activity modulator HflK [Alphaproteobacteria bacterium]
MGWDDRDKKNPWGKPGNDDRGSWGSEGGKRGGRGGGGGGSEPPDLDEMLRKAQQNFRSVMPGRFQGAPIIFILIIGIIALWLASGFYVVNPGEHAVIQRFGAWSRTQAEPGLGYHMPTPIETATVLNVEEIQKMNIGFIEAFSRNGASSRRDLPDESLMLTSDRNIVDLDLVIQWNIKSSEDYLFEIRDQENTIKKVAESAIREVVGQTDMFPIITTGRAAVAEAAKTIIQTNLDEYKSGVNITQVLIERAEVHPDVQAAFQDVQSAKQDAEDVQNRAEAYREDILPRARGAAIQMLQEAEAYKQSTIDRSKGDTARFEDIYQAYLTGKDVTRERIYLETMENVLGNAQKIILDGKAGSGAVPYLPLNELTRVAPASGENSNAGKPVSRSYGNSP